MPTYCFQCEACDHYFETIRKIAEMDEPLSEKCTKCGEVKNKRVHMGSTHAFMRPEQLGRVKAPEDFRNWLSAVKKVNKGSTIRDH